jgi:hypothetical protein
MKIFLKMALILSICFTVLNAKEIDKDSGLIVDKGLETVKANCTVCHSARFIILQKGDRATWKAMIVWMQKTQGLWQFTPEVEDEILTYLETNYPPSESSRRPNLKAKDLPSK